MVEVVWDIYPREGLKKSISVHTPEKIHVIEDVVFVLCGPHGPNGGITVCW